MFDRLLNIPLKDICMTFKIVWKGFWEVVLIFVFKVVQIFLRRYFRYFNDHFQNSYFIEHWGILQPVTLPTKKIPSHSYFQGFPNFLGTPVLRSATLFLLLGEIYLEYFETFTKISKNTTRLMHGKICYWNPVLYGGQRGSDNFLVWRFVFVSSRQR